MPVIEISHYDWATPSVGWHDKNICLSDSPAWEQPVTQDGLLCRPIIRCNCGRWCGIGGHHVHVDGTITASFFHAHSSTGLKWSSEDGCGWHVFLKLKGYSGGEFTPS